MKAKKGEEKGKWQKAIIGIVMAAIMLGSVLVAMVPTSVGRPTANEIDVGDTIYIGEQGLAFDVDWDGDYGEAGTPDDFAILEGVPSTVTEGEPPLTLSATYTVPDVTEGKYYFDANGNGVLDPGEFYIFVDNAEITGDIILNTATQDSVVGGSIPTSSEIVFKVETNFGWRVPGACIDIKLIDPDGVLIRCLDGLLIRNVPVLGTTMFVGDPAPTTIAPPYPDAIDLTDLDVGTYMVKMKTDKATCNMLDVSSPEYEFTVREYELSIEAEKDAVYRGENIALKVTGNPKTFYYLTVTGVDMTAPPMINDVGDIRALDVAGVAYPAPNLAAWIKTGVDGIADVKIATTGADDRTYTINVYDTTEITVPMFDPDAIVATSPLTTDDDSVDVEVLPPEVTFDIPNIAAVGEEVTIRGAISAGDYVDIVIEDADVFDDVPVDENNEFEVDWDTSGLFTGLYWIDVYIDCPIWGWDPDAYHDIDEDGSTIIWLVAPRLTAEQPRNVIAEGDDYTIEGIATGVDDVDIALIGPNGYSPSVPWFDVLDGLEIISTPVTDDEFSEDITLAEDINIGTWTAMVLAPGLDGIYGDLDVGAGELAYLPTAWFAGKTQDQIVARLENHTINVAESDDLLVSFTFEVETPYVSFNPIENVTIGEPLEITGLTNREPGTIIAILTFAGPTLLPPVITEVEWPAADQGVLSATVDTSDAVPGSYTLKADDGEGNTDTATVEIRVPTLIPPAPEVSISTDKKEYSPGDVINTTIRLSNPTGNAQSMLFKWYFGIPDHNNWTKIEQRTVNLSANSDQSSTTSIPVDGWENESFCGCYIVSLTNTTTNNVVSVDSASWIYLPSAECKSKTSAEIAKGIVGVKLQS